jgi:ActR/RegA family two-component response regulator
MLTEKRVSHLIFHVVRVGVFSSSNPMFGESMDQKDPNYQSILLIDDSFVLRDRLAEAFAERDFRVEVAGTCDEGVAVFRNNPTDLAVVDLRMPGRTGLTVIADLKAIKPDVKVLILSGFGSIATAIDAIRLGAVNFLPKPADADDILSAFKRSRLWPKPSGNTSIAYWRTVSRTFRKPLGGWGFTVDPFRENFASELREPSSQVLVG